MIVAETPDLILRRLAWDDLDDLATLYADPIAMATMGGPRTYEATRRRLGEILDDYGRHGFGLWATVLKADGALVGRCGLLVQEVDGRREVEVGYMIARAYWGRGLATQAARASRDLGLGPLGLERLIAIIEPRNVASQRVATKVGMAHEKDTTWDGMPVRIYATHRPGPR
jgi:[ribosomal protein S5]-alanine N-acetyltransferase